LASQSSKDDPIADLYQYILSQVIKCSRCGKVIDGFDVFNAGNDE